MPDAGGRRDFWLYRGLSDVGRYAPSPVGWLLARVGGRLSWRLLPRRRELMAGHLTRLSRGGLAGRELDRAVRAAFDSYARYWLESSRVPGRSAAELERRASSSGLERLDRALAAGRGAILALPHLGNWDEGGAYLAAAGYPLTAVAERLDPPRLFEWFVEQRRAFGVTAVPLGPEAATATSTVLRANGVVALLCDRDVGGTGIDVEFFGEVTKLPGGPALIALRTGAALLPSAVYLTAGGIRAVVQPPVEVRRSTRPLREDVRDITQELARAMEALIVAAPEQWHVFRPNWPSDPGFGS